jgi:tetratricopeptide (TPR) repeat protein
MARRNVRGWWVVLIWALWALPCHPQEVSQPIETAATKAAVALQEGRAEEAFSLLQPVTKEAPGYIQGRFLMGAALNRLQRYPEALGHLQFVQAKDPRLPGLQEELAVTLHNLGKEQEALAALDQALEEQPPTGRLHLLRGTVLLRLERWKEARHSFEEAAKLAPELRGVCFYRAGAISYNLRDYAAARGYLGAVVKEGKDEQAVAASRQLLARMDKEEGTAKYSAALWAGFEYDSNVRIQPDDLVLPIKKDKEDVRFVFQGSGDYKFIQSGPWELGTTLSLYSSSHFDLREYDLHGPLGMVYGGYRWGPLYGRIRYQYSYYWLDTDSYLRQHGTGPEIWWTQAPWAKLNVGYLYTKNAYFDQPGRDSFNHRAGFAQYFYWKQDAVLRFSYFVDTEHADGGDWDYIGHQLGLTGSVRLPWQMRAQAGVEYYLRDYDNRHTVFGERRDDDRWTFSVELSRRMTDFLDLALGYTRIRNESSISFYEYNRDIVAFQVRAAF